MSSKNLIIKRSLGSIGRQLKTRAPIELMFSVTVVSASFGYCSFETSGGTNQPDSFLNAPLGRKHDIEASTAFLLRDGFFSKYGLTISGVNLPLEATCFPAHTIICPRRNASQSNSHFGIH